MSTFGKRTHSVGEVDVVDFHDESKDVAAFAAAEAMPQLSGWIYLARRRLLVVERATAPEIATPLTYGDAFAEKGNDVGCFADFLYVFVANRHAVIITQTKYAASTREVGSRMPETSTPIGTPKKYAKRSSGWATRKYPICSLNQRLKQK